MTGLAMAPADPAGRDLTTRRRTARAGRPAAGDTALRLLLPALVLGAWWMLTGLGVIAPTVLSSPLVTWNTFYDLLQHHHLLVDIAASLERAAVGLAIGGGFGLLFGLVTGLSSIGERLFDLGLQMLRMVPFPALLFLFIVWFGIGESAKYALIALATLFPMYLNVSNGVRNVDRRVVEAARSFGVRGWALVRHVVVPLAMPSVLTGLRYSAGVSIIALVFAETINANTGIGYLVSQAESFNQTSTLVVCILIYALLGLAVDLAVRILEWRLMPWRRHVAVR
ncbi:MAG: ABC transporter permease [Actinomycetota bacterium]|nr:ABC transporter permease [Actinomycetota bacterium]